MSTEEARKLHELIADDEELQAQFSGLESRGQVTDKLMEIATAEKLKVNREDVATLLCELSKKAGEINDANL